MDNRNTKITLSDELINSFIDGQLTQEERREILDLMQHDKTLANKVCELQHLKQLTRAAYYEIPASRATNSIQPPTNPLPRIAAAIAIFCFGLLLGTLVLSPGASTPSQPVMAETQTTSRVLVHLTSADRISAQSTLSNLEQMLQQYRDNGQAVQVEVVANGQGINLLREGFSPLQAQIGRLVDKYDNLSFAACKNTINQMRVSEGREIRLIPQARIIDSGVVEVIKRQQQGWTYIRG